MKTAIVSLHNKFRSEVLVDFLVLKNYNVLASGGTFSYLLQKCLVQTPSYCQHIIPIEDKIDFPHILNGRVKTLHPYIHGGLLANMDKSEHITDLQTHNIDKISVAVANLYPFERTIEETDDENEIVEQIDIGGHTLLRAAAKNYKNNIVLYSPDQYDYFLDKYDVIMKSIDLRRELAKDAFNYVTEYDIAISNYLSKEKKEKVFYSFTKKDEFKYGANPHQTPSSLWSINETENKKQSLPFKTLNGKMSYINMLDAINSWSLVSEMQETTGKVSAASFKHTSPAGTSISRSLTLEEQAINFVKKDELLSESTKAYILARGVDPKSSFGDFIAISGHVDTILANRIKGEISDGIVAKSYSEKALSILKKKKGGNYVILQGMPVSKEKEVEMKIFGNYSISQMSNIERTKKEIILAGVKTEIPVSNNNILDMMVANITLKYAQSNSVALTKNGTLVGIGCGQQSRIDCVRLACEKAFVNYIRYNPLSISLLPCFKPSIKKQEKINAIIQYIENDFTNEQYDEWKKLFKDEIQLMLPNKKQSMKNEMNGITMASDGFFPFYDNIDLAYKYGVNSIIQPGGSIKDEGIIKRCDTYGIAMSLTGVRHFFH